MSKNRQALVSAMDDFLDRTVRANLSDPSAVIEKDDEELFNEFIAGVKMEGHRTDLWTEGDWRAAMDKAGIPDDLQCDYMEMVAAWGVDD